MSGVGATVGGQTGDTQLAGGERVDAGAHDPPRPRPCRMELVPSLVDEVWRPAAVRQIHAGRELGAGLAAAAADAARAVVVTNGQDLRSPDGRDAARPSSTPVPSATPDNGTDWGEIGMITGAVVLALGGVGAVFYITRRRALLRKSGATVAPS